MGLNPISLYMNKWCKCNPTTAFFTLMQSGILFHPVEIGSLCIHTCRKWSSSNVSNHSGALVQGTGIWSRGHIHLSGLQGSKSWLGTPAPCASALDIKQLGWPEGHLTLALHLRPRFPGCSKAESWVVPQRSSLPHFQGCSTWGFLLLQCGHPAMCLQLDIWIPKWYLPSGAWLKNQD